MYDAREGLQYQHPTNSLNRQYSQQAQFLQNGGHSHVAPTGDVSLEEEFRYSQYIHALLSSLSHLLGILTKKNGGTGGRVSGGLCGEVCGALQHGPGGLRAGVRLAGGAGGIPRHTTVPPGPDPGNIRQQQDIA